LFTPFFFKKNEKLPPDKLPLFFFLHMMAQTAIKRGDKYVLWQQQLLFHPDHPVCPVLLRRFRRMRKQLRFQRLQLQLQLRQQLRKRGDVAATGFPNKSARLPVKRWVIQAADMPVFSHRLIRARPPGLPSGEE